ncbi:MAG: hypothetical protein CEN90_283 [Parcubacteria group bacterium Licking1014_17]|nr:MAG: hypothetical protein CEN90_283 [Parcubacteria group bacterium Licking1014_17]
MRKIGITCFIVGLVVFLAYILNLLVEMERYSGLMINIRMYESLNSLEMREYEIKGRPEDSKRTFEEKTHKTYLQLQMLYKEARLCRWRALVPDPTNNYFLLDRKVAEEIKKNNVGYPVYYKAVSESICSGGRCQEPPIVIEPLHPVWW